MPRLEELSDQELTKLNGSHGWVCGTRDAKGRILGNKGRIYDIPERRVVMAEKALGFAGKTVVEFGCLEGCHTVALARQAVSVTAIDFQDKNLEKSRLRCGLYGVSPTFLKLDVEAQDPPPADLYFHSGVLYHLQDPVSHLIRIAPLAKELFLDTHHARKAADRYVAAADGKQYLFSKHGEATHPRAGAGTFSRWITLDAIVSTLKRFYRKVVIIRDEDERNGARVTIAAAGK
jgi:tRNA (mo5U34)-methyltransferase